MLRMYKVISRYQAPKKQYPVSARVVQTLPNEFVVYVDHETAGVIYTKSYDDFDSAEEARNSYMSRAKSYVKIAPSLMVNSALWAYRHEDYKRAYGLLVNAVSDYPDYVPGLVSYGKLAWIDSQPVEMSDLEISLRKCHNMVYLNNSMSHSAIYGHIPSELENIILLL